MTGFCNLPDAILDRVVAFLPQQSKLHLAQTSFRFYKLSTKHLYRSLSFQEHVILQDPTGFADSLATGISGFQNVLMSAEFDEKLMTVRQNILANSVTLNPELLAHIQVVRVSKLYAAGSDAHASIVAFLEVVAAGPNLRNVQIVDQTLLAQVNPLLQQSALIEAVTVLNDPLVPVQVSHVNLNLARDSPDIAARLLPSLRRATGIAFGENTSYIHTLKALSASGPLTLSRLTINLHHGFNGFNDELRTEVHAFLNALDFAKLARLELRLGCEYAYECECMTEYLDTLAPKLTALTHVSISEKAMYKDHKFSEKWDMAVLRFLIQIPAPIRYLSIRHYTPVDGNIKDGLDGNYIRRRVLYENALPKLASLETLVAPTFMQSCACYEVLMSDLLWNGCQCPFCEKIQSLLDDFIIHHQYYDVEDGDFRDVITPRFFAAAGDAMSKRLVRQVSDLELVSTPPCVARWGFHGYSDITCGEDFECDFNQSAFAPLVIVLSHFMEAYIKFLMGSNLRLREVVLSGVYFELGTERNGTRKFRCVYDNC
ncbi:hypothetical protein BABINDRAFT_165480 [Babjeviella inositovora NRRL Y-12698]|uniref:F-box domain-containing protein n=1 Tax=Babjeviella inositovora NRRL Y-12698 TaxID=984486 RepID=A0A1E3QWC5_9ASCO|nr:uncharacterized protein BABINDRAFT_165480 [Babjeviella inositovora NRRL Y-12698]ODQ81975.1 hypothetical protein BABINDRAFT_165480 [Babjeviella inositovora NRRL Y-12698]